MTWAIVLTSLFVLLLLTALVSWFVLYIQFCNSVEKRWAIQVLTLLNDAERRIHSENRQLRELKTERDAKARSLHEEAFAAHLCDYSVGELVLLRYVSLASSWRNHKLSGLWMPNS
jgi:hypothetical protein